MRKIFTLSVTIVIAGATLFAAAAQIPLRQSQLSGARVGDPEQGRHVVEVKCAECHGAEGNSADPQVPKLAGQHPAYLYWQLWAFRTGARQSDTMAAIATALTDADMANAASFYSRQSRKPDAVKDPTAAGVGERIFFAGARPGAAPPCAMCHGAPGRGGMPMMMGRMPMMGMRGMMGMMANAPNLNGQHAAYIVDQLNHFASGERQATVMGRIAAGLSETHKKAVAEYLSGLS